VFLSPVSPAYSTAVEFVQSGKADPLDWRWGPLDGRSGLWIEYGIFMRLRGGPQLSPSWKAPSDIEVTESLKRVAARPREEIEP